MDELELRRVSLLLLSPLKDWPVLVLVVFSSFPRWESGGAPTTQPPGISSSSPSMSGLWLRRRALPTITSTTQTPPPLLPHGALPRGTIAPTPTATPTATRAPPAAPSPPLRARAQRHHIRDFARRSSGRVRALPRLGPRPLGRAPVLAKEEAHGDAGRAGGRRRRLVVPLGVVAAAVGREARELVFEVEACLREGLGSVRALVCLSGLVAEEGREEGKDGRTSFLTVLHQISISLDSSTRAALYRRCRSSYVSPASTMPPVDDDVVAVAVAAAAALLLLPPLPVGRARLAMLLAASFLLYG
ncbi:hypothetical protein HDK64DRAFT_258567 [Phyllosticta capitalensis]